MGYNISIGEAKLEDNLAEVVKSLAAKEECVGEPYCAFSVDRVELPGAPDYHGDTNPRANVRWPSYSGWADFARAVGLYDYFLGDSSEHYGVMKQHPGEHLIQQADLDTVDAAVNQYAATHPLEPGFCSCDMFRPNAVCKCGSENRDPQKARLLWLQWWMHWAVENCRVPILKNT